MFGYVMANPQELTPRQRERYLGCYCGICRAIGANASYPSRLVLNYDMVFLALLLSSLYEPAEEQGQGRCLAHPLAPRPWVRSEAVAYAADMNVALAYFSAGDNWRDDRRPDALALQKLLRRHYESIRSRFPRQCRAMETCIGDLSRLEAEHCPNPDLPANCFGLLMAPSCFAGGRTGGPGTCGRWPWGWAGLFTSSTRWWITGRTCGEAGTIPSGPWAGSRTRRSGRTIWSWRWAGPPGPMRCCLWSRTRSCWTTSYTAASG